MDDYIIDEKLLKDIQEVGFSSSPLPMNPKNTKPQYKYNSEVTYISQQPPPIPKKEKNSNELYNKLKKAYDILGKENQNLQRDVSTLSNEKNEMLSHINQLKDYCGELEKKLMASAKNQKVSDVNNKLKKENYELRQKLVELESLRSETRTEDNENLLSKISLLEGQLKELQNINQELNFAKENLTQVILGKENIINNLTIERDSFKANYEKAIKDMKALKENSAASEMNEQLKNENNILSQKLYETEAKAKEQNQKLFMENNELYDEKEKYRKMYSGLIEKFNNQFTIDYKQSFDDSSIIQQIMNLKESNKLLISEIEKSIKKV